MGSLIPNDISESKASHSVLHGSALTDGKAWYRRVWARTTAGTIVCPLGCRPLGSLSYNH
jgi:hypothetical protein